MIFIIYVKLEFFCFSKSYIIKNSGKGLKKKLLKFFLMTNQILCLRSHSFRRWNFVMFLSERKKSIKFAPKRFDFNDPATKSNATQMQLSVCPLAYSCHRQLMILVYIKVNKCAGVRYSGEGGYLRFLVTIGVVKICTKGYPLFGF